MSRRDDERLDDILASAQAICARLERGGLDDGLVFGDLPPLVGAVERLLNSFDSASES